MQTYADSPNLWFTDFPFQDRLSNLQKLDSWIVGKLLKFGPHKRINGQPAIDMGTFTYLEQELVGRGWDKVGAARAIHKAVRGPVRTAKADLRLDLQ